MKKIIALTLALLMALACVSAVAEETYNIGIVQLVQHEALDQATKGFQDALTELMGDKVKFDLQNASGDAPTCATIVNGFVAADVDLIMANATPALQAAVAATADIPVLGTSISHYGTALDMNDNWQGFTGINVSGTSDLSPLNEQAAMVKELSRKRKASLCCSARRRPTACIRWTLSRQS